MLAIQKYDSSKGMVGISLTSEHGMSRLGCNWDRVVSKQLTILQEMIVLFEYQVKNRLRLTVDDMMMKKIAAMRR